MQDHIWDIVSAKINGEKLCQDEMRQFTTWMEADVRNRQIFTRLEKYYEMYRRGVPPVEDIEGAYELCLSRYKRKKKRSGKMLWLRYGVAASVLLVFSMCAIFMYESSVTSNEITDGQRWPGRNKATLTLTSGESILLGLHQDMDIQEQDGIIKNREQLLVYAGQDTSLKVAKVNYNTLSIPRGGEYRLELSDGTKVWLNSETRLTYPVTFDKNERKVFLEGEAYFEVAKDVDWPFVVNVKSMDVEVLGTSFNVMAYGECDFTYATLVEGSVRVRSLVGTPREDVLKPGEQVKLNTQTGALDVNPVDVLLYTSWKDGYYTFEKECLEMLMNTLARWYDLDVSFAEDNIKNVRFSGRVKRYESCLEFLETLKLTYDVEFEINNRTVVVRKRK